MRAPLLIVGQGLAGTVLGHACERAGIAFEITDAGHASAASRVGAGIINPITGQRIVKSQGIDALREPALRIYRELETVLGVALVREMRVRRLFRDDGERRVFAEKAARGELAPYACVEAGGGRGGADAEGFWIEGALRIDTALLIAAARARWLRAGVLREERVVLAEALAEYETVIACTGADEAGAWGGVRCVRASGTILRIAVAGLAPDVILNGGHWVLPTEPGEARVGATYVRDGAGDAGGDVAEAAKAREELERSAAALLGGAGFAVMGQDAGWRVTTADRLPIVGRDSRERRLGIFNGLGSKGTLLAPWLAEQWVRHLREGAAFEPGVAVDRFAGR